VQVVVGTPGRVHDMINRGALGLLLFFCVQTHSCMFLQTQKA
jgi:superfamily II DNA/RNA helicase